MNYLLWLKEYNFSCVARVTCAEVGTHPDLHLG